MEQFGYEKLDVYQRAMELLAKVHLICGALPKGNAYLADQLRRACLSIPLNIAEGSAKPSLPERRRFYHIARASALECSAIITCCLTLRLADPAHLADCRSLLLRIVQMLSKLAPSKP